MQHITLTFGLEKAISHVASFDAQLNPYTILTLALATLTLIQVLTVVLTTTTIPLVRPTVILNQRLPFPDTKPIMCNWKHTATQQETSNPAGPLVH